MRLLADPEVRFLETVDEIVGAVSGLRSEETQLPSDLELAERARRHLRSANGKLWGTINDLERFLYDSQLNDLDVIAEIAEDHGKPFAALLRSLIDQGVVEVRADRDRLRKERKKK